jgi:hypothetical protein
VTPNPEYWPFKPGDLIQHTTTRVFYVVLWWERIPGPYEDIRVRVWNLTQNQIGHDTISSFAKGLWALCATPDTTEDTSTQDD